MNTVALFADRWILPGLHVTVRSLLEHAHDSPPTRVVVFGDGLRPRDGELLKATAAPILGRHRLEIRACDVSRFHRFRSLRGNHTTYGRLALPELLADVPACVYLDCDLIVTTPLDALFALAESRRPLHADGGGRREASLDSHTFRRLGLNLSTPYFNAGVLVYNLDAWRERDLAAACVAVLDAHTRDLLSADEAVLNIALGDECGRFGETFNTHLYPSTPAVPSADRDGRIFHFVGAPKPWDYLGRYGHRNDAFWRNWSVRTAWHSDWRSRVALQSGVHKRLRMLPATFRELRRRYAPAV